MFGLATSLRTGSHEGSQEVENPTDSCVTYLVTADAGTVQTGQRTGIVEQRSPLVLFCDSPAQIFLIGHNRLT
jgi:hypothetical protein